MAWLARLNRAYTILVGIAFAVVVPLLVIDKAREYGWPSVLLFLLACFLIGAWRYWPSRE